MITIELVNCFEEQDGSYTVKIKAIDENLQEFGPKSFQVTSAAELKTLVKPILIQLVDAQRKSQMISEMAQAVLDEIMTEVPQ